ncbi:hypothetical protein BN10_360022 [Phycicoccus elongatus Lp2]|uniref:Uncharacterized protein n=1 Tax=Phycicoccus elongatus Lp2 TaxID=1193181 RepID=N0E286_9MICO|nr:hypothetical protein BN10_360022 [Phycicoccus elongatus Lp2]
MVPTATMLGRVAGPCPGMLGTGPEGLFWITAAFATRAIMSVNRSARSSDPPIEATQLMN